MKKVINVIAYILLKTLVIYIPATIICRVLLVIRKIALTLFSQQDIFSLLDITGKQCLCVLHHFTVYQQIFFLNITMEHWRDVYPFTLLTFIKLKKKTCRFLVCGSGRRRKCPANSRMNVDFLFTASIENNHFILLLKMRGSFSVPACVQIVLNVYEPCAVNHSLKIYLFELVKKDRTRASNHSIYP